MLEFAKQEIIIPDGPFENEPFRCDTQPWCRLWFAEVDSGRWQRHVSTGPSQSGKTLSCYIIPAMYHLFEIGETVICGVPKMEMARDKWEKDFLPAIQKSRFRDLLPTSGKGSRGGAFETITFQNGASLKFMTGGGDDKSRAAFTARVLVVTEVDGMDTGSELSRESDPISQLEARSRAYGQRRRVYLECTVTIPTGRIWQEYTSGSAAKIMLRCPHCSVWVCPERDDFLGWDSAETEIKAESAGQFYCPECGQAWSAMQRLEANRQSKLVHRGQEITPEGEIVGNLPETRTLGFRWSAVNNLFSDEKQLGAEEWVSARKPDRDSAEKERCQFVWCIPYTGANTGLEISEQIVASRLTGIPRGVLPNDVVSLVAQVDLHNRYHYWTVMAISTGQVRSIVDYGLFLTPNPDVNGPELAIRLGLEQLGAELTERKWTTADGREHPIDLFFVDAGYQQDIGLTFCHELGDRFRMHKGDKDKFTLPKEPTGEQMPGDHWYLSRQAPAEAINGQRWWLLLSDTKYWMRAVHAGFIAEPFQDDGTTRRPGTIALFGSDSSVHQSPVDRSVSRSNYAAQLLAWKWGEITTPKRGTQLDWIPQWKEDHWFDTTYGCLVAASLMEAILAERNAAPQRPRVHVETRPDGREWV